MATSSLLSQSKRFALVQKVIQRRHVVVAVVSAASAVLTRHRTIWSSQMVLLLGREEATNVGNILVAFTASPSCPRGSKQDSGRPRRDKTNTSLLREVAGDE